MKKKLIVFSLILMLALVIQQGFIIEKAHAFSFPVNISRAIEAYEYASWECTGAPASIWEDCMNYNFWAYYN